MNNTLRLGIDIDGTITDPQTFIPFINSAFKKNLTFTEITQFDLAPLYGISNEDFMTWFLKHEGDIYAQAPVAEHAQKILMQLAQQHTLIYISARNQQYQQLTQDWFDQNQVPYHHIELLGTHDKIAVAKKQQVQLFFEDKLDNANDLAEELEIPVILFDTPYNQGSTHQFVKRMNNWQEVLQLEQFVMGTVR